MPYDLLPSAFFPLNDGGRLRYALFEPTTPPRGTILIVPGRREFIEKKFLELGQPLLDKGYRLIVVELRGQGLSSRALTGDHHQRDHTEDFKGNLDDLRVFFQGVVVPNLSGPLILHGHSLGGHYLLRWLAEDHPPIAGIFVTAPMLAIAGAPAHLAAQGISWLGVRLFGNSYDYAPLQNDFGASELQFANNPLTHDPERFLMIERYFSAHPQLTVGGVTWGWLLAALQSMHITHGRNYLSQIRAPLLAMTGSEDRVTPAHEVNRYLRHIPDAQIHIIQNARHDILNEADGPRRQAWSYIHDFLDNLKTA